MAGLPDKRECHPDRRPHAQPRVTAIVPTRRRDGGQMDTRSGTGHNFRVASTAHSTHRQASMFGAPPGSRAALACSHRRYTRTLRCEMSSRAGQSLMTSCFPAVYLGVKWRSHYRLPLRPRIDYAALLSLSHQPRPDDRKWTPILTGPRRQWLSPRPCSMAGVNATLTVFLLAPVVRYGNKVQQPIRARPSRVATNTRARLRSLTASLVASVVCIQMVF